jgi:hypothetical protein
LHLEALEDRLVPSGGPGTSAPSGSSGGPSPSALVSTSGGTGTSTPGGPSGGVQQTQTAQPPPVVMNFVQQALASIGQSLPGTGPGYPVAPSCGPALNGSLLSPTDVSALPAPMQQSAVAVVPLMLTGTDSATLLALPPPPGYSVSLVTTTTATGTTTFLVVSTAAPATTAPAPGA